MLITFLSILVILKDLFTDWQKEKASVLNTTAEVLGNNKDSIDMNNLQSKGTEAAAAAVSEVASDFSVIKSSLTSNNVLKFQSGNKRQFLEITKENTTILGSAGGHDHGSSKVIMKNIVDYKWEVKNYPGHLIAVHIDGNHFAYAMLNVKNRDLGSEGMVRVSNVQTGHRSLIKGMFGEVLDLQFAHIESDRILACIDTSSLHIFKIESTPTSLVVTFNIKITDFIDNYSPKYDKIAWCPCAPEESSINQDDYEDPKKLIVWARGNVFQCFNLTTIIKSHFGQCLESDELKSGHLRHYSKKLTITWVQFSPDGSTLGVGSDDGYIRFYQIYFYEQDLRCLHQWKPHGGQPISSFFFLDNLTAPSHDSYWKYAITCSDDNTELKVWYCSEWECLQTVKIKTADERKVKFIAELDRTSSYLVLSNIDTKAFYVLQIRTADSIDSTLSDFESNSNGNDSSSSPQPLTGKRRLFIKSISEFPLSSAILSFSIIDAAVRKYKCGGLNESLIDEMDEYDEENMALYCVVVRMMIVQSKSVQECNILYQPPVEESADLKSTISNDTNFPELIDSESALVSEETDITEKLSALIVTENEAIDSSSSGFKNVSQVNLMTPDAFNSFTSGSGGKKTPDSVSSEVLTTILMLAGVTGSNTKSTNNQDNLNLLNLVNNKMIEDQEHEKIQNLESEKILLSKYPVVDTNHKRIDQLTSGGSSPSREVQEIMSLQEAVDAKMDELLVLNNTDVQDPEDSLRELGDPEAFAKRLNAFQVQFPSILTAEVPKEVSTDSADGTNERNDQNSSELNNLNTKMDTLLAMCHMQVTEITSLRAELKKSKQEADTKIEQMQKNTQNLLVKGFDEQFSRYKKENDSKIKQLLDILIQAGTHRQREVIDNMKQMSEHFDANISENISKAIQNESQNILLPHVASQLEKMQQQIQIDVNNKLTTTDRILKECIGQVCKSKSIIDTFGKSVLAGVQDSLQAAFMKSMSSTLIPAYEKSSQNMFHQLHEAFTVGIKQFMEQFNGYLSKLQPVQETTQEILDRIAAFREMLDESLKKQKSINYENILEARKDIKTVEINITRQLGDLIKNELRKNFESQAASLEDSVLSVVRSQAQTPAPSIYDVQEQIKNLLNQGEYHKAFHQALIANDLSLVEYTLEKADHKQVFNPCRLGQTVLLSLIQQISADMNNHNDIKQRYLSDGILNLDLSDAVTREHAPKVLNELFKNCQSYLKLLPKSPLSSNVRMIMMAIQGMGLNQLKPQLSF